MWSPSTLWAQQMDKRRMEGWEKCGIHHQYNVCVCVCVCVCVHQSALPWQPLQTPFSLCGDCLSVSLFGADMKLSC